MKTHNQRMDVIGNNISNVNTTGYKTSEVTFKDVYYQTKANASSGDSTSGGRNPTQIGYGSQLGTVSQVMVQSGFTYSDSVFNCALQGEGFFQVMDEAGNIYYTRAGKFSVDSYGNLCDPNGNMVLGVSGDPTGIDNGMSQRINLKVPAIDNNRATTDKTVRASDGEPYNITITASDYGENGNISFTIVNSDKPFATRNGDNMTIYLNLDEAKYGDAYFTAIETNYPDGFDTAKTFSINGTDRTINSQADLDNLKEEAVEAALQEFRDEINEAIRLGGVVTDSDVFFPLSLDFESLPSFEKVKALNAKNTVYFPYETNNGGTTTSGEVGLTFTADKAGEAANKFEVDIKYSTSNKVSAAWKGDILTITLPNNLGALTDPTGATIQDNPTAMIQKIQDAIDSATDNADKHITVSLEATDRDGNAVAGTSLASVNFSTALGSNIQRLGLQDGRDNFFSDVAVALSTVTLTDGRTAKEQAVDDLEVIQIDYDGTIYGRHAVHGQLLLGRIDIATFENPTGLEQCGTSLWRQSLASGPAQVKIAGKDGAGEVIQGALEMSNVDLAQEFSDMIITQRGYQANSRIITVSDTMLEELVNLKR